MRNFLIAGLLAVAPFTTAIAGSGPVVVELFTSESCSSCPPADAFIAELARTRPDVLPLGFHVDYWNQLNWRDQYSSRAATDRQRDYAALLGTEVYTPQLVAGGKFQAVGSDRGAALAAIAQAQALPHDPTPLAVTAAGNRLHIAVGSGQGAARVLLVGYDTHHETHVGAGENEGVTVPEANVVRSLSVLGAWAGPAAAFTASRPLGERVVVLLQAPDGQIRGAAAP